MEIDVVMDVMPTGQVYAAPVVAGTGEPIERVVSTSLEAGVGKCTRLTLVIALPKRPRTEKKQ